MLLNVVFNDPLDCRVDVIPSADDACNFPFNTQNIDIVSLVEQPL